MVKEPPLGDYHGDTLNKLVVPVEKLSGSGAIADSAAGARYIAAGHAVVIFIDLILDKNTPIPTVLHHRFTFAITFKDGKRGERMIAAPGVPLVHQPVPVLHPPLLGKGWIAFNALGSENHRRAFNAVDGRLRIAERFAIDWMRIGPDGRLFRTDGKDSKDYYGYGQQVLAVGNGRICALKNGLPDNTGNNNQASRAITLDNIVGNYVTIDLGGGHYALYAHLQPGSIRVKLGQKVTAGQVVGLLGNSGNSDAPHLHFQLSDGNSPLGSEGIPYALPGFTQLGILPNGEFLDLGGSWYPDHHKPPLACKFEFPLDNAVLTLP